MMNRMGMILLFILFMGSSDHAHSQATLTEVMNNGPTDKRLNIVFLAEGYTSTQQSKFLYDVNKVLAIMFLDQPYQEYRPYFNAFSIFVASNESGSDKPWSVFRDTYFNSTYFSFGVERLITIPPNDFDPDYDHGQGKVDSLLEMLMPEHDIVIMVVNDPEYGGSGGSIAITSTNSASPEIVIHEVGHSFALLGDEYEEETGGYTGWEAPNTTQDTIRDSIRWHVWIADSTPIPTPELMQYGNVVGLFEGAQYNATGWYRPQLFCKMRDLSSPFCAVCNEAMIKNMYQRVRPIDSIAPSVSPISLSWAYDHILLQVWVKNPSSHSLNVRWLLDGVSLNWPDSISFNATGLRLGNGTHHVKAEVVDSSSMVRNDLLGILKDSASWTVNVSGVDTCAPPWQYVTNPGCQLFISINTSSLKTKLNGQPIAMGDAIGAFYVRGNDTVCGGYVHWFDTNTVLTVNGDDPLTLQKDGFSPGEIMLFRIWDCTAQAQYNVYAHMRENDPRYLCGGIYNLDTLRVGSPTMKQEFIVNDGWNLISVPFRTTDMDTKTLFPNSSSRAFTYQQGYTAIESLVFGAGYWVKFDRPDSIAAVGEPIVYDTIPLSVNWNLIGSPANPVNVSSLISLPTGIINGPAFAYHSGYMMSDSLLPGVAYWLRSSQNGKLVLGSIPFTSKKSRPHTDELETMCKLTFQEGCNHQILYWGRNGKTNIDPEAYILPPRPPEGIFDARFPSNRMIELVTSGKSQEFPIMITSAHYPLTVGWELKEMDISAWLVVDGKEIPLKADGSVQISDHKSEMSENEPPHILLRLAGSSDLPSRYALEQNYPNPFNPTTVLRYQIPVESKVTLAVYNVLGQVVERLVDQTEQAGYKQAEWNAVHVVSGVYFYIFEATSITDPHKTYSQVRKMLLVR